ncbi:hypothetical protein ACFO1B_05180 [Dactylosporangium siamense]|uniref:Uncharacterized protein n=1 Tax=Dactylosporangium siamense TaxID=685454 RepID=A0A919PDD8_9ACTN|nr:hypothetical protein [Dactylosporangium siamense]GIG42720.1 hypothetical protein Dsi01nite_007610 [Dactylosporangium siamense]
MPSTEEVPALTGTQLLALVVLMAEARPLNNTELKTLAGFALTGADNKKLVGLGLVETDRTQRPFAHELTDQGWAVVQRIRTPPARTTSAVRSLVTLLTNIDRALQGRSSHAMFFTRTTEEPGEGPTVDLESKVRLGYDKLTPGPGEWVSLADLRDALDGVDRTDLDTTLRAMARQRGVRIIPVANTKALSDRERAASLSLGDEPHHVLAIGAA